MSFSINVPSIKIPSSTPKSSIHNYSNSNNSNNSNSNNSSATSATSAISAISTNPDLLPPVDTGSPSPSTATAFAFNSPSFAANTPSVSYTINPYSTPTPNTPNTPNDASSFNGYNIKCNTPNTINNILTNKKNRRRTRHKRAYYKPNKPHKANKPNQSSSSSQSPLPMSVTPLTPNIDITFNFDVNTIDIMEKQQDDEKQKTFQDHLSSKTLHALREIENNINNKTDVDDVDITDIDVEMSSTPNDVQSEYVKHSECKKEEEEEYEIILIDEDDATEMVLLSENGYIKVRKITDTLQGTVFVALNSNNIETGTNSIVVIKRTSKILHNKSVTIQNGKEYTVNENVLKEYQVLKYFTSSLKCPSQITKILDFFETDHNYYLVMEHSGDDFFEFIVNAHKLINEDKLKVKEWRKFVKYMFYQMVVVVKWLHSDMNCCHLDISLENLTVQNGNFILGPDGFFTIDPNIKLKFIDFGLAEFFNPNDGFQCVKYCGKTAYKAPEIYKQKKIFDARKADIWSLGVVLFCIAVGSPPYVKPSNSDDAFKYYIKPRMIEKLLFQWNRHFCVTVKMLDLLKNMMECDLSQRYLIEDVLKHSWLSIYYKQYKATYGAQQIGQLNKEENNSIFPQLSIYKLPINNK